MEKMEKILVTPEMAKEFLKKNVVNRNLKPSTIKQYAYDMKNGYWHTGYDPIVFNNRGELENGQHRLNAIITSKTPTFLWVITNADTAMESYDRGVPRKISDSLQIKFGRNNLPIKHINAKVAICRFALKHGFNNDKPSDTLIEKFILEYNENLEDTVRFCGRKEGKASKALCKKASIETACFAAMVCNVNKEMLSEFCGIVNSGFPTESWMTSPVVLRNELVEAQFKTRKAGKYYEAISEFAIDDFMKKKSRKVKYTTGQRSLPYFQKMVTDIGNKDFMLNR